MPKATDQITIQAKFFTWRIYLRKECWYADGRSGNGTAVLKRYSLESSLLQEARENLKLLDVTKAVELGRADASLLNEYGVGCDGLSLEDGKAKYLAHVKRPPVLGGAGESTAKRYRAVFAKFLDFAQRNGVGSWQDVGKGLLEQYGT
jgi:hypothetical protein